MDNVNYEGYARHTPYMSRRVRMRKSHPELTAVDKVVMYLLKQKLKSKKSITLLDAGCGTGERLKMIFERGGFSPESIIATGIDFCPSLVQEARGKIIFGKKLYGQITTEALETLRMARKFDVVLCLFSVLNNVGIKYLGALSNLAQCTADKGILLFDFIHPQAGEKLFGKRHQELEEKYGTLGKNEFYYIRRSDQSWGKAYLFPFEDLQKRKDDRILLDGTDLVIRNVQDILVYKTPQGKFSVARPYRIQGGYFRPDSDRYPKMWNNSVLVVAERI